jgi:hypothetical protein
MWPKAVGLFQSSYNAGQEFAIPRTLGLFQDCVDEPGIHYCHKVQRNRIQNK